MIRKNIRKNTHDLYHSYDRILTEKYKAYPEQITIKKQKCEVNNVMFA